MSYFAGKYLLLVLEMVSIAISFYYLPESQAETVKLNTIVFPSDMSYGKLALIGKSPRGLSYEGNV